MKDEAVAWFRGAVAQPRTPLSVWAGHLRLHVAAWNDGDTHKPPMLLVHGFRAHAQWWDHIAPSFVAQWRVYALDFSGMGQSAWREHYTRQGFTDDVVTVARWLKERAPGRALAVVGHSYGGSRLLDACAQQPGLIDHAIVLDAPLPGAGSVEPTPAVNRSVRPEGDRAAILARFRLSPEQPAWPCIRSYIAEHSITAAAEGGWRWRFDPAVLAVIGGPFDQRDALRRVVARVDVVRGERSSIVSADSADGMASLLPHARGPFVLPQAHHHLMLDQPLALVDLIGSLLGDRPRSQETSHDPTE